MNFPQGKVGFRKPLIHGYKTNRDKILEAVFPDTTRPVNVLGYYYKRIDNLGIEVSLYLVEKHMDTETHNPDLTNIEGFFDSYCDIPAERFEVLSSYEKRDIMWMPEWAIDIVEENRYAKYNLDRID